MQIPEDPCSSSHYNSNSKKQTNIGRNGCIANKTRKEYSQKSNHDCACLSYASRRKSYEKSYTSKCFWRSGLSQQNNGFIFNRLFFKKCRQAEPFANKSFFFYFYILFDINTNRGFPA